MAELQPSLLLGSGRVEEALQQLRIAWNERQKRVLPFRECFDILRQAAHSTQLQEAFWPLVLELLSRSCAGTLRQPLGADGLLQLQEGFTWLLDCTVQGAAQMHWSSLASVFLALAHAYIGLPPAMQHRVWSLICSCLSSRGNAELLLARGGQAYDDVCAAVQALLRYTQAASDPSPVTWLLASQRSATTHACIELILASPLPMQPALSNQPLRPELLTQQSAVQQCAWALASLHASLRALGSIAVQFIAAAPPIISTPMPGSQLFQQCNVPPVNASTLLLRALGSAYSSPGQQEPSQPTVLAASTDPWVAVHAAVQLTGCAGLLEGAVSHMRMQHAAALTQHAAALEPPLRQLQVALQEGLSAAGQLAAAADSNELLPAAQASLHVQLLAVLAGSCWSRLQAQPTTAPLLAPTSQAPQHPPTPARQGPTAHPAVLAVRSVFAVPLSLSRVCDLLLRPNQQLPADPWVIAGPPAAVALERQCASLHYTDLALHIRAVTEAIRVGLPLAALLQMLQELSTGAARLHNQYAALAQTAHVVGAAGPARRSPAALSLQQGGVLLAALDAGMLRALLGRAFVCCTTLAAALADALLPLPRSAARHAHVQANSMHGNAAGPQPEKQGLLEPARGAAIGASALSSGAIASELLGVMACMAFAAFVLPAHTQLVKRLVASLHGHAMDAVPHLLRALPCYEAIIGTGTPLTQWGGFAPAGRPTSSHGEPRQLGSMLPPSAYTSYLTELPWYSCTVTLSKLSFLLPITAAQVSSLHTTAAVAAAERLLPWVFLLLQPSDTSDIFLTGQLHAMSARPDNAAVLQQQQADAYQQRRSLAHTLFGVLVEALCSSGNSPLAQSAAMYYTECALAGISSQTLSEDAGPSNALWDAAGLHGAAGALALDMQAHAGCMAQMYTCLPLNSATKVWCFRRLLTEALAVCGAPARTGSMHGPREGSLVQLLWSCVAQALTAIDYALLPACMSALQPALRAASAAGSGSTCLQALHDTLLMNNDQARKGPLLEWLHAAARDAGGVLGALRMAGAQQDSAKAQQPYAVHVAMH